MHIIPMNSISELTVNDNGRMFQAAITAGDAFFLKQYDPSQSGNFLNEALNEYVKAVELQSDDPELLSRIANIYLKQGKYDKARKIASRILELTPAHPGALWMLGYSAYRHNQYEEAIHCLKHALHRKNRPFFLSGSRIRLYLASAYRHHAQQSEQKLQKTFRYFGFIYHLLCAVCLYPFAAETDQCLKIPFLLKVLPKLIHAYCLEYAKNYDDSLRHLLALFQQYPGLPLLMNSIGDLYFLKGQELEAEFWFHETLQRDPANEEAAVKLARIYESKSDFTAARGIYHRLLALSPNDAMLHCQLGNAYYLERDYEQALIHYKASLILSENEEWKSFLAKNIGKIFHEQLNQPEPALMSFQHAIQLNPADIENYIHLGLIYFEQRQYPNAELVYRKALRIDSQNPQLYSSLAYLKWIQDEIDEAVCLYEQAIELDPYYDIPYNNLGVIYLDSIGNIPKAIMLFKQAVELNDDYALGYFNLGRAFSLTQQRLDAATCFQKAQQLNEKTQELDESDLSERLYDIFNSFE